MLDSPLLIIIFFKIQGCILRKINDSIQRKGVTETQRIDTGIYK